MSEHFSLPVWNVEGWKVKSEIKDLSGDVLVQLRMGGQMDRDTLAQKLHVNPQALDVVLIALLQRGQIVQTGWASDDVYDTNATYRAKSIDADDVTKAATLADLVGDEIKIDQALAKFESAMQNQVDQLYKFYST